MIPNKRICELINQADLCNGATYIAASDEIDADYNGCSINPDSIRRFVELVAAEASNQIHLEDGAKIQNLIILLENNRKAYLTELEDLRDKASWSEKWRGIAVARDGDGRTVQAVQTEARDEERKACENIAEHFTGSYEVGQEGKAIAAAIRARADIPVPTGTKSKPSPEFLQAIIAAYYDQPGNICGGTLHIALDDYNLEDEHVRWCLNHAREQGDENGIFVAKMLLLYDEAERIKLLSPAYEFRNEVLNGDTP